MGYSTTRGSELQIFEISSRSVGDISRFRDSENIVSSFMWVNLICTLVTLHAKMLGAYVTKTSEEAFYPENL